MPAKFKLKGKATFKLKKCFISYFNYMIQALVIKTQPNIKTAKHWQDTHFVLMY